MKQENQPGQQEGQGQNNTPEYTPHHLDLDGFDNAILESDDIPDSDADNKPNKVPTFESDDDNTDGGDNAENGNNNSDAGDGGEGGDDGEQGGENIFMFGDEEIQPGETVKETPREKELREEVERLRKGQQSQQPQQEEELTEPGLYDDGIEGDHEKYQEAMKQYYRDLGKREAQQERETQEREHRRQVDQARFKENVALYGQQIAKVKSTLPDIEQADDFLGRELPQLHQTALFSAGVENPEMVAYALYKNKALREAFTKEQNPFRLGMMVADISKKARLAPKAPAAKLEKAPKPKGSTGAHPNKYGLSGEFASAEIE